MEFITPSKALKIVKKLKRLTPPDDYEIIEINKPKNKFMKKDMYKIFTKKILDITGEKENLLNHSFTINYKEKICYFYEFLFFGKNILESFKPYKIILNEKKSNTLINIFVFNKIDI